MFISIMHIYYIQMLKRRANSEASSCSICLQISRSGQIRYDTLSYDPLSSFLQKTKLPCSALSADSAK